MSDTIQIQGDYLPCGVYLLRLVVGADLQVRFGRFHNGDLLPVTNGVYLYIGSAMGQRGASSLAHRLLRHATRQAGPPHAIRQPLLESLKAANLGPQGLQPSHSKKLFWHIDYLLEETAVTLSHIFILRTIQNLEKQLASDLMINPDTKIFLPGLGARDMPEQTHLLKIPRNISWWHGNTTQISLSNQIGIN